MYIFSTTTLKPLSTTKRWNGRDPGDYYFYHGGPEEDWDTRVDYFFGDETELKTRSTTENIEHGVSYLGLFLNLVHFYVLTRKELRSNVVFIIMIGICFSDILVFSSSILERYFGKSDEIGYAEGWCGTRRQWWMILMELVTQAVQKCGKLSSAILVFFMACIRSFSVLFPMSSMVNTLMKVRTGVVIVVVTMVACGGWYYEYYSEYHIQKPQKFKEACYTAFITNYGRIHMMLEGYSVLCLTILYAIITIILLISLRIAHKRRKNLGNEKQLAYMMEFISKSILTLNSILHCFICYFLSSQYREVVKQMMCWGRKAKKESVEPVTRSVARDTEVVEHSV